MISHHHKFIYIHIPKTAGNSVQVALAPYSDDAVSLRPSMGHVKDEDGGQGLAVSNDKLGFITPEHKHATLQQYRDVLGRSASDYFVFASIRNPWDRVVSATAFRFGELGLGVKMVPERMHLPAPMSSFLSIDEMPAQDAVIRFEHLAEDFAAICRRLDIESPSLTHRNRSCRGPYRDFYTDETRTLVAKQYAEDIERFGYQF